jgi:predicted metalloprotease with PDZ domain
MRPSRLLPFLTLFGLVGVAAGAQNVITYHVTPRMADKALQIRIDIPRVKEPIVRVQIPVWSPGAYMVGNYAVNIADLTAEDADHKPLHVYHPDPNTWEIAVHGTQVVRVGYTLKNVDLEMADGTPRRGHISGPRSYLYVVGRKAEPVALAIETPANAKVWRVATSLDPAEGEPADAATPAPTHRYVAPTYDVLADAPVEMGDFAEERFDAAGRPHYVVLYGQYDKIDRAKLVGYCKRIAETENAFFGDTPYHRYIFEFRASNGASRGAGGLEHLGSTEIGTVSVVDDRTRSVIAHEFFHLWNVKRIRPFVLGPFNYVDPPRTANLWWAEGVTSYYGDLLSRRAGLNTDDEYLKHLAETITDLQNNPARLKVSADESSLRVFDVNNSQGFGGLSYYTKGELVGLCLDLKVRQVTGGNRSLDDVMRALYAQVRHGEGPGYGEDDIEKTLDRVSGHDLSSFYDSAVRGTDELPFEECLSYVGLNLTPDPTPEVVAYLGMGMRPGQDFRTLLVSEVEAGGAAATAGLKDGDQIVAAGGQSDMRGIVQTLRSVAAGKQITITVQRGSEKLDVPFTMGSKNRTVWHVTVNPAATPAQVRLRGQWLTGK